MWIADNWKDYEVIDCSKGEKLERWGDFYLVRPDPQVIWDVPGTNEHWKKKNGHYHRSSKGGGEWEFFNLPEEWSIRYRKLTFRLKPFSFKHTGLFPEQAVNWDWFSSIIKEAKSKNPDRPLKVLNLFAYTGGGRHPRGRLQRHGILGKGKRRRIRPCRRAHPLAGRRLRQVRGAGNPARQYLRRHHHGSAFLRPWSQGRNLETGRQYLSLY